MKILEQENDYIKREIQKLTMVLKKLIDKTNSADINNFQAIVSETDEKLKEFFDMSLTEIVAPENFELVKRLENINEEHLENLINLLFQIFQKSQEYKIEQAIDMTKLSEKLLLMIDLANEKTNDFSIERMNIKNKIIQIKNSTK
ncbi:hypothetical protein QRD02_01410 [Aequorivita sp. SDUM287046]|uniref:TerB family tellurite resistance protein n=1 Tax=Aequorivita aurantiaca TaxID=3053356 RepID=A0ABT8DCZ1_9FLAO|nr:hypothetical protein [Aequorivita aurantiaca]MDN3723026.1 hypothetical protein [Aequorivita aurantiaca]